MGARQRQKLLKRRRAAETTARARSRTRAVAVTGTMITVAGAAFAGTVPAQAGAVVATPRLVADLVAGDDSSYLSDAVAVGSTLYFTAYDEDDDGELWRSDGTTAGTQRVADINPTDSSSPTSLTAVGGTLYFVADDGTHGQELWTTDGTTDGTRMVADANPGPGSGAPYASITAFGDGVLFTGYRDASGDQAATGVELWRSDGTAAGTSLVKDINPGAGNGMSFARNLVVDGHLYFNAFQPGTGVELWKSDGTAAGTTLVKDVAPGPANGAAGTGAQMVQVGGTLFFEGDDGTHGSELWKTDGTLSGTSMVRDVAPGATHGLTGGAGSILAVGDTVYFSGYTPSSGGKLWSTDGTAAGTTMLAGAGIDVNDGEPFDLTELDGTVYFVAGSDVAGNELWTSDGTAAGTTLLTDIAPGSFSSSPSGLVALGDRLWFSANSGVGGRELWSTDGTAADTSLAADVRPGPGSSSPQRLTATDERVFFTASTPETGRELWTVDVVPVVTPTPTPTPTSTPSTAPPAVPTTAPTPAPVPDTAVSAGAVKAKSSQKQGKKVSVVVRASAAEAVTAAAKGTIKLAGQKKAITLTAKPVTTKGSGAAATITLKVSKKDAAQVLAALKRYRNADTKKAKNTYAVTAKVRVTLTDAAGNTVAKKVTVTLV